MTSNLSESLSFGKVDALPKLNQQWVLTCFASIAINALALSFPLLMMQVYDRILPHAAYSTLSILTFSVLIAISMEASLRMARSYLTAWSAARFEHAGMMALASRFLAEPLHQFEQKGTGAVMQLFKAVSNLKYHHSGQSFQNLLDLPFTLLYIGIVLFLSPLLGFMLIVAYALYALLTWYKNRNFPQLIEEHHQADLRRGNFLNETLGHIHTIKSMSMDFLMMRRYARLQESCARVLGRLTYALDSSNVAGATFSTFTTLLITAMGAWLVVENRLSGGELAACMLLCSRALSPVQRLGGIWSKYQQDKIHQQQISRVLSQTEFLNQKQPDSELKPCWVNKEFQPVHLAVKGLSYQFPSMKSEIFRDVNFEIAPGEFVWLDMASGAGRSTLLQVLAGVLPTQAGDVKIGPEGSNSLNIAYVARDAQIFEGSLLENISFFDNKRIENALACASAMGFDDFIAKMPRGWDSVVGDMATESLPQGYRQRISIIRALSGQPGLILIDDAASTLDAQGGQKFQDFLISLKGQVTVLIVSDRVSYQQLASRRVHIPSKLNLEVSEKGAGQEDLKQKNASLDLNSFKLLTPKSNLISNLRWQETEHAVNSQFREVSDLEKSLVPLLKSLKALKSAREVAEALPYFYDHLDLAHFNNTMARLGFKADVSKCHLNEIESHSLPCLFVPDVGSAMVVIEHTKSGWLVHSASEAAPILESRSNLIGQACYYTRVKRNEDRSVSWVKSLLPRFNPMIVRACLVALLTGILLTVSPMLMMHIYSSIIPSGSSDGLLSLFCGAFLALMISYVFSRNRAQILAHISTRIEFLFGSEIFEKILKMPPAMTEKASVGSQMARLRSFEAIRDAFTGPLAATLLELPSTVVLLVALAIINPVSILVFIGLLSIYWVLYKFYAKPTAEAVKNMSITVTERDRFLIEMISKMRSIRANGGAQAWMYRFRSVSAQATMSGFKVESMTASVVALSLFVMSMSALLVIAVTTPLVISQTLSSGVLIASIFLMWRVLTPLQILFTNISRIERIKSAAFQIDNLMRMEIEAKRAAPTIGNQTVKGAVEFSRITFRYLQNSDPAISAVNFSVQPGEIFAISGSSGAGKSTLLKLLLGAYSPQGGAILLDGTDSRQFDALDLRRLMGYAPQEIQLFRATLEQNLRLARPDATKQEIFSALEMAGAMSQIQELALGLQTRVGDNTQTLSSSLKQKLSLARAYLTQAPILLLDEPGALLDKEGEIKFIETLSSLRGKVTVLLVSQQISYLKLADTVMLMDHGFMKAIGKPKDLLIHSSIH